MKTFVPALLLGVLVGAGLMLAVRHGETELPEAPELGPGTSTPGTATPGVPEWNEPPPEPRQEPGAFDGGTAVLRVGDAYDFGEDRARPQPKAEDFDVLCLDLRDTASLLCPAGAAAALLPLATASGPPTPGESFSLVGDAPAEFEGETVELLREANGERSGVALVRAAAGICYKVVAVEFHDDPHALRRFVRIRYARVPEVAGGGIVPVPGGVGSARVDPETAAKLRPRFLAPSEIRPSRGTRVVTGDFVRLGEIPDVFIAGNHGAYVLPRRLDTKLTVGALTSVCLEQGASRTALIEGDFHSGIVVDGEMAGRVETEGSFVRVRGDLTGTLLANNSTVVVEGDHLGTIEVTGIPQILIKGTVRDPATAFKGDGIPRIYVGGYTTRAQVESFPKQNGIWTLYLAESDIPTGEHRGMSAFWSLVSVGAEFWPKLLR